MKTALFDRGDAVFSPCGRYRYRLTREGLGPRTERATFIMLNPSTADASVNDPTIRRCIGYALDWDFGGLTVVNAYAWRDTKPDKMFRAQRSGQDIVGPINDAAIELAIGEAALVVVAWGKNIEARRQERILELLRGADRAAYCFKRNGDGTPVHPLYQPKNCPMVQWP